MTKNTALFVLSTLFVTTACADDGRPDYGDGIGSLGDGGDDAMGDQGDGLDGLDSSGLDSGGSLLDMGAIDPEGQEEEECASVTAGAEAKKLPADIIIVVDNSGSMAAEASAVQAELNDFSQQIIASGVDVHVSLISSYPGDGHGICIDAPLGSGGCPGSDDNLPLFNHVNQFVSSHDALQRVLQSYGEWGPSTREDATTHILVVSDDESNMSGQQFLDQFYALRPDYADLRLHAVVSMHNCSYAADIGDTYINLGAQTNGVVADLCDQNFGPVFDALSAEVIGGSLLPCEFAIPEPPEGESFDPDKVNVALDDGMGTVTTIPRVDDAGQCAFVAEGWYYDDPENPSAILMCEQTCGSFQGLEQGNVEIMFGCETKIAE